MENLHTIYSDKRNSGIPLIGNLPWGTDFCQFYQTEMDLLEILVPYFRAGLESNERCIWITSRPLNVEDARKALKKALPHFKEYADKGQIEIISLRHWRAQGGMTGGAIVSKLDKAILSGFDGLRLACNAVPETRGGRDFTFDGADVISRYNVIAVFPYPRDKFDAVGLMEAVKNHRFALVRNADRWELIESSEVRIIRDALRRSEEKLQSLFRNMSEGFAYHRIVLDAGGKPCDYIFHEVNDAFESLTGLKKEDIIGRRVTEVLPGIEKDPTDWIGKYGQVALTGKPVQLESYSEVIKRWYSVSAFSPHKGYFAVTFSDITERKHMEQALRESEEKLRVTLTSIGDAVIATDAAGCITFMNSAAAHLTGWEVDEAQGRAIDEVFRIINEQTRKPAEDILRRVLEEGCVAALANHTALVTRDGQEIPIEDSAAPIRDRSGKVLGVVLVFHDVTEQRRAQQALRESETKLRAILENLNQGVVVSNLDGKMFYWNPASLEMHGFHSMEESQRRLPEFTDTFELSTLDGEVLSLDQWPLSRILRGEHLRNWEVQVRRIDNDWQRVFSYGGNLARDSSGQTLVAVVTVNDITERKGMEEALHSAKVHLEERVRERTEQLRNLSSARLASHERERKRLAHELHDGLGSLLTAIKLKAELALADNDNQSIKGVFNLLNEAIKESRRMQMALRPSILDDLGLLPTLDWLASQLQPGHDLDVDRFFDVEEDDIPVSLTTVIFRICQEALNNATKHSEADVVRMSLRKSNGHLELVVQDNGKGFDIEESLEKDSLTRGFGLIGMKERAELSGGSLFIDSAPGKGTTIHAKWPLEHAQD
jgi:PAS domain S-box-containing protein